MDSNPEVIVVSDLSNQNINCSILDLKTGSVIHSFKEGKSVKKCLSFIGQDYIISAVQNKPSLKVWVLNQEMTQGHSFPIPGTPSALAVSNCGTYCVAAINNIFYVWEVATGAIATIVKHHSKPITCLKFSADGTFLITAGIDGIVLVWLLTQLVSASDSADNVKPYYVWLDHAAEITDIHVGALSIFAQVATVSKDMTCRIHDLESGRLLATVHVDFPITAVTMDNAEYFLMLGSPEGNIYRVNMFAVNESDVKYNSTDENYMYAGHKKEITCLSVSISGKILVSGSEDGELKVWDVMSFSCTRKFSFQGPITNAFITLLPPGLRIDCTYHPLLIVSDFHREYEETDTEFVTANIQPKKLTLWHLESTDESFDPRLLNYSQESLDALNRNNVNEKMMSVINHQMYSFALSSSYSFADSPRLKEDTD